jgi:Tfp pilus assembly protein PilF
MFHTRIRAFVLVLLFAAAVAGCGRDPKAYIARGDAYVKEKKYAEASIEFRKAIQKDQRNGEARYRLGLVYEALGSRPAAGGEFIRAADLMPDNDEVQAKAGVYFLHAKRFEEAKRVGDKLLKKNPRNLNAQLLVANAYAGLKDLDAAVVRIEDAITLDPTRVDSYANLAAFELSIGNAEKAESAFRNAIAASPKSVEARLGLANLFWARGQSADAEALLKEALALEPRHPLANRTLAAFYLSSNRVEDGG